MVSEKPDTMVVAWVQRKGLSVSPHRGVSPKMASRRSSSAGEYRRRWGSMRIWQRRETEWTRWPVCLVDLELEQQGGRGGVGVGRDAEDLEVQVTHVDVLIRPWP